MAAPCRWAGKLLSGGTWPDAVIGQIKKFTKRWETIMRENISKSPLILLWVCFIWPTLLFAQQNADDADSNRTSRGYILKSGEGEDTFGDGSSITKASPATGTQGTVFVEDKMPPAGTSGVHKHLEADEFFYVLEGSGRMLLDEEEHAIEAGDFVFVPVHTYHRITSSKEDPLHVIFVVDRPGLDEQFRLEFQGLDRTKMTVEEFNDIVRQYGTVYRTFD